MTPGGKGKNPKVVKTKQEVEKRTMLELVFRHGGGSRQNIIDKTTGEDVGGPNKK